MAGDPLLPAPALIGRNGAVLKHASNVPQCALAIEEAIRDAGFPEGLFRTLLLVGARSSRSSPTTASARSR